MADEILTGKNVNEAKKKVTDEKVNKLLKDAQKQLNKDINVELTSEERAEKEKAIKEAKEKAEIGEDGIFSGKLKAGSLGVHPGAKITGTVNISGQN